MRRRSFRARLFVGIAVLLLVILGLHSGRSSAAPGGNGGDRSEAQNGPARAEAVRLRRVFGLAANDGAVAAAETRGKGGRGNLQQGFITPGIPLTDDEEKDMRWRMELQSAVDPLVEAVDREPTETAGVWIDQQRHGRIVVNLT
jgi:hypothetical protein